MIIMPQQQAAISSVLCTAGGKIREIMKTITPPRSGGQSPVITRASNEGLRRFRNHGEGPYYGLNTVSQHEIAMSALVCTFNQEKALVGAFCVIVKSSRPFI